MVYICKGSCESSPRKKAMINIRQSFAYRIANRCTKCSESNKSIWYLKWVNKCPCCGSGLRRNTHKKKQIREETLI